MAKKKLTLEDMLVSKDEIPYEVPENWTSVKLTSIFKFEKGKKPKVLLDEEDEQTIPYVTINYFQTKQASQYTYETETNRICKDDDILIVWDGARAGLVGMGVSGALGSTLCKIKFNRLNSKFVYYYFVEKYDEINKNTKGTGIPHVDPSYLETLVFNIPPLAEQERIVNRIESLFDKVDRAAELVDEARDGFEKRRAAILERAFSGQLTKKWREENGVSNEWEEVKLGKISKLITKGSSPRWQGIEYVEDKSQVLFVTSENVREGYLDLQVEKYLQNEFNEKQKRSILEKEDILLNIVGASIGRAAIFNLDKIANINQAVSLIRLDNKESCKYICYYLNSSYAKQYYLENKVEVARANLSLKDVNNIPIPLPSLKEQNKIIEILDSILYKEHEISEISDLSENIDIIKKSILAKAFRGELGSNDLNEESSIELLKELIK